MVKRAQPIRRCGILPLVFAASIIALSACDSGSDANATRFHPLPGPVDASVGSSIAFTPEDVQRIAGLSEVAAAEGSSTAYSVTARHAGTGKEREAIVVTAAVDQQLRSLEVVSGTYPATVGEACVDDQVAATLGWTTGDQLALSRHSSSVEVVVTGVCVRPEGDEFGASELIVAVPLGNIASIAGSNGAGEVMIRLTGPESASTLYESVRTSLGRDVAMIYGDHLRGVLE